MLEETKRQNILLDERIQIISTKIIQILKSEIQFWNKSSKNTNDSKLTRYDFKLSTTHASRASFPIVTVMLGIGSAKRGKFNSVGKKMREKNISFY